MSVTDALSRIAKLTRRPLMPLLLLILVQWLVPAQISFAGVSGVFKPGVVIALLLLPLAIHSLVFDTRWTRAPVVWGLLAFLVATFASYFAAAARLAQASELRAADRGVVLTLAWTAAALYAAFTLTDTRRLQRLAQVLVAATAVACVVAMLQTLGLDLTDFRPPPGLVRTAGGDGPIQSRAGLARVSGTMSHPIELGVVVSMVLPIALVHAGFREQWRWKICALIIVSTLPLALSRTSIAALAVGLLCLALFVGWRERLIGMAAALIVVVAMVIAVPQYVAATVDLFVGLSDDPSLTGRTNDYAAAVPFIVASPLFGLGVRTFLPQQYFFVDNQFLMTTLDMGLFGIAALVLLIVMAAARLAGAARRVPGHRSPSIFAGFLAALFSAVVGMASFDALSFPTFSLFFFLLLGIGCRAVLQQLSNTRGDSCAIIHSHSHVQQ